MGASSDKERKSIKLTPGKQKQVAMAITLLREHYGDVLSVWRELTPAQREAVLVHSPLLTGLLELTGGANAA